MRNSLFSFLLILSFLPAHGRRFETVQDGNFEEKETWGGKIPGLGDSIYIEHQVEYHSNFKQGEGGYLSISDGASFSGCFQFVNMCNATTVIYGKLRARNAYFEHLIFQDGEIEVEGVVTIIPCNGFAGTGYISRLNWGCWELPGATGPSPEPPPPFPSHYPWMTAFPIPAVNVLTCVFHDFPDGIPIKVSIIDLNGRVLLSDFVFEGQQNVQIDISTLSAGVYFIKYICRNWEGELKFIKTQE
jgi:Secretion system C-terminal sorting domain